MTLLLLFGGLILTGLALMLVDEGSCIRGILVTIGIVFMIVGFCKGEIHYRETHKTEESKIVIEIEDKKERSHYRGLPGKGGHRVHDYYIYWDDNQIEVSPSIYRKYNIGDTIVITKTTTYELQDDNTWAVEYVSYN